tara:strand:- start:17 stop:634 length:618 start_codon:yes stop_codon:yes gene_type:complete
MYDRAKAIKHPDRKRKEFLGTVGLNGNNHLIDLNKEQAYLNEVVFGRNHETKTNLTNTASNMTGVLETKGDDNGVPLDEVDPDPMEAPLGAASKADTETSLYKLIMLSDLCANSPTSATPAISMMLKYCKKLRDRDLSTGSSYLFDDLIPPTEQVTEARRQPYQELAANRFTQSIFLLTQRLPHMLTSLTCVLGYLAAIPEGDGK